MKQTIRLVTGLFAIAVLFIHATFAATPLVDVDWVRANAGKDGVVIVDLRPKYLYQRGHIPGAVNSGYRADKWRMKKGKVVGMLPPTPYLEKLIGRLGIDNNTHVVLVHGGFSAADTGKATRVYWTFNVLGHNNISILNGGMRAWLRDRKNPLQTSPVQPVAKTFTAHMDKSILAETADVEAALKNGTTLIDSRPTDQHLGINQSGAITRTGTLPGAISLPGRWMTINDKGTIRPKSFLARMYAVRNAPAKGKTIVFCNTGHWASLGWFIDHELLGNSQSKMYDGSMADWSRQDPASHPMVVRMNLGQ